MSHCHFPNPNTTWAAQRSRGLSRREIDGGPEVTYIEIVIQEIYYLSKLILVGTMSKQLYVSLLTIAFLTCITQRLRSVAGNVM